MSLFVIQYGCTTIVFMRMGIVRMQGFRNGNKFSGNEKPSNYKLPFPLNVWENNSIRATFLCFGLIWNFTGRSLYAFIVSLFSSHSRVNCWLTTRRGFESFRLQDVVPLTFPTPQRRSISIFPMASDGPENWEKFSAALGKMLTYHLFVSAGAFIFRSFVPHKMQICRSGKVLVLQPGIPHWRTYIEENNRYASDCFYSQIYHLLCACKQNCKE